MSANQAAERRLCAGTGSYEQAIKDAQKETREAIAALKKEAAADPAKSTANNALIEKKKEELRAVVAENKELMAQARHDHKYSDKEYAQTLVKQVEEEYAPRLKAAANNPSELKGRAACREKH